jgi:sortase A
VRFVIPKKSLRVVLRWTQRALFASAALTLSYCGFVLIDAWIFQRGERLRLESLLHEQQSATRGRSHTEPPGSPKQLPPAAPGDLIGSIEIPRLGLSAIIVEGTDKATLRRAVGHIPGTPQPGQIGNAGLAGHRDTFFRPLKDIQQNDIITLKTLHGEYRYRVVSTRVVAPTEVSVLDPTGNETLTLVTCHPFYFVGSAPNRFIVRAERVTGLAGSG